MNELYDAMARRPAFQFAVQFAMVTGKLLLVTRESQPRVADELETASLTMLRWVLDSTDCVQTRTGQRRVARALHYGRNAKTVLDYLHTTSTERGLTGAALETLERALSALQAETDNPPE